MFGRRTLDRLDRMLDEAISGTFEESDYDESKLSKLESKWKRFLEASALSRESVEKEKDKVKELVSDISHQTKTPMANLRLYTELLKERMEAEEEGLKESVGLKKGADLAGSSEGQLREARQENLRLLGEIGRQADKLGFLIQSLTKMRSEERRVGKECM